MHLRLAQINPTVGDIAGNLELVKEAWKSAPQRTDLVISPELVVCGYPPLDLLNEESFISSCMEAVQKLAAEFPGHPPLLLGCPWILEEKPFNAAVLLHKGKVQKVFTKRFLPNYDVFDEKRYFTEGQHETVLHLENGLCLITICEDLWASNPGQLLQESMYSASSLSAIINLSASPFAYNQQQYREQAIGKFSKEANALVAYCNQVGANTELIFDGRSGLYGESGPISHTLSFTAECIDVTLPASSDPLPTGQKSNEPSLWEKEVINALILGIQDYFKKLNLKQALLGLSGGLDSALVAYLASKALGAENVLAVLMPSEYSSKHSINDALALAKKLGISTKEIPIKSSLATLTDALPAKLSTLTQENLQARTRGLLLMALANEENRILLNTSNKSEVAVGYTTIYGDMCGGLSIIGDVWKTQAYQLAHYINRNQEIIPKEILLKPPSAELRPNQTDADELPDYEHLDPFLIEIIEEGKTLASCQTQTLSEKDQERVYQLIERSEWKRFQSPPILRVSDKAFGQGRRIPIAKRRS